MERLLVLTCEELTTRQSFTRNQLVIYSDKTSERRQEYGQTGFACNETVFFSNYRNIHY